LDDSAGPTNLVLTNSFWAAGEGTFMAGTNTNGSSMTLAGPISGLTNIVAINSVENAGKLILKGTNTFIGRLQLAQRARVYVVDQLNIPNQIYFSDTTGAGRFGMDASAAESVTLTNEILVGVSATNIIGTFNPGTNATSGGNRTLHLSGVISGSGRVRVADGGDLCLDNPANTYTNLTRIGTGRVLFGSDGALGSTNTNSAVPGAYGGIRFETISSSYLVPTNNVILDAGRALLIQNNNTANLDSQGFTLTVAGSVQDEVEGQPGSVNKLGSGEVVLSGTLTYSGNTTVSAGKLTLKQINSSNESSTVSIVAGANLNLDFVGSDTVDKLYLNGVQSAAGTYNSTNSGGAIIGTGSLVVTSSPVIANTAPVITAAQGFSVAENASLGTVVGTVAATDADANSSLSTWTIVSGNTGSAFAINSATGQITVAGALNFEGTTSYSLGVTVSDGTATSAEGTVVVAVTNIAEYSDFFGSSSPTADDNGDGISNLMAYALGATSPSSLVVPPTLTTSDATKLTITALIRINDPKLNVVGEYGTTLGTWVTGSPIPGVENSSQAGVVAGVTQRQDFSVSRGTDPKKFLHLKATLQP
jgi:autotransporter-associated beta strand protein